MATNSRTFDGTGADASGSSGDANRVLTLSNTGITKQDGLLVYASGLALGLNTEYTISHNSSSSEITFLNPLWDDMTVVVKYDEKQAVGVGSDFLNGPLADFGVTAVRTPVTKTTDFSGNKTYTDGTDEAINIVLQPYNTKYDLDKSGLNKSYDMMAFVGPNVTLNKYDKITYDSKIYRVDNISARDFNGTSVMKKAMLFYVEDA
jgi:hypothetical protein